VNKNEWDAVSKSMIQHVKHHYAGNLSGLNPSAVIAGASGESGYTSPTMTKLMQHINETAKKSLIQICTPSKADRVHSIFYGYADLKDKPVAISVVVEGQKPGSRQAGKLAMQLISYLEATK
jgi:hypothetical protein